MKQEYIWTLTEEETLPIDPTIDSFFELGLKLLFRDVDVNHVTEGRAYPKFFVTDMTMRCKFRSVKTSGKRFGPRHVTLVLKSDQKEYYRWISRKHWQERLIQPDDWIIPLTCDPKIYLASFGFERDDAYLWLKLQQGDIPGRQLSWHPEMDEIVISGLFYRFLVNEGKEVIVQMSSRYDVLRGCQSLICQVKSRLVAEGDIVVFNVRFIVNG